MTNNGLTSKEIKNFLDLLVKANDEQLKKLRNSIMDEQLKRCKVL